MTDEKLFETLKHSIKHGNGIAPDVFAILMEYKKSGGHQKNAQKLAEELRILFSDDEIKEEKVLEILDIIVGWCRPDLKIWN
jgi:hypothetical protein